MHDRYVGDVGDFGSTGCCVHCAAGTSTVRRFASACFGTASTGTTRPPLTTGAIATVSSHHPVMSGSCADATPNSSRKRSIS